MKLSKLPDKILSSFNIDGREGNRVGYWCDHCKKAIPVNESEIDWEFSFLANGKHRPCGNNVESIWDE